MEKKKIEGIKSSQEFSQQQIQREYVARNVPDYNIWANLVNMRFEKTVYYYKVKIRAVDEEKAEFTITIEKDFNLRQKLLQQFGIYQKLNEMFVGRYVYNDTLVKVIDTQPDKRWEMVYQHQNETYNLELVVELLGEKTDQKSVLAYCRDILQIFQKNVIKYQRFGKQCFFDPSTREPVRGCDTIDVVTGLDMNINIYKPNTMKLNMDFKVGTVFNRDVTHFLKEQFQRHDQVSYDALMKFLQNRKFTDGDNRLYLDELTPKKEVYSPVEVMNLHATMYRSLRNMRFKRDPQVLRMSNLTFCVDNKDLNDSITMATKRKQMKDFQFFAFCNNTLQKLRNHWMFKENGIVFDTNFNVIPIERQLSCQIQLGNNQIVSTHDTEGKYDRKYNDAYKNISSKILQMAKNTLERWIIVYEGSQGMKEKVQAMINKMQNQLANVYGIKISNPNVVEVRDIQQFDWSNIKQAEIALFVISSRNKKEVLTRKYEVVKYQCDKQGNIPNQIIMSKTFEQHDFLRLVMLNVMYDLMMKLPNNIGHKVLFDGEMTRWLNNSTMVFGMDVCHRKNYKSVASILSYLNSDMNVFRTEYLVKDEEMSELKYSDEVKHKFKEIIKKHITDYEYHNNTTVHKLVFFRDGITDSQRRFVDNTEIAYINEVFAELGRDRMQLWFLTANKRISTKIFEWNQRDNKLNHLEAGVYTARDIVKDTLPSFYLNSSNNRLSKCCYYECLYPKVVENQADFDNLTSLVFKLSFVYFHAYNLANISVPGILKYAEKKANFYSIIYSLKTDEDEGKDMFDTQGDALKRKRD